MLAALLPLTLLWGAQIDIGVYLTNCLGLLLFVLMHVALGIAASALMRTPIAAAMSALAVSLVLWFAELAAQLDPQAQMVNSLSSLTRMRGFAQGLLVSADIIYFIAWTLAFLLIAILALNAERRLA